MNGRIYDPLLGRFLSADILVSNPGSLQSFNRYSYVGNRPLSTNDPSGFESAEEKKDREALAKEKADAETAKYGAMIRQYGIVGAASLSGAAEIAASSGSEQASSSSTPAKGKSDKQSVTSSGTGTGGEVKTTQPATKPDAPNSGDASNSTRVLGYNFQTEPGSWARVGEMLNPMTHIRAINSLFDAAGDAAQEIGDRTIGPGLNYRAGFIAATFLIGPGEERVIAGTVERAGAQVLKNRAAGNAFRDELAGLLRSEGRDVATEVYKRTPFGRRFIDIEVSMDGRVLGGIETKVGSSRYTPLQQIKDRWLYTAEDYIVNVARKP